MRLRVGTSGGRPLTRRALTQSRTPTARTNPLGLFDGFWVHRVVGNFALFPLAKLVLKGSPETTDSKAVSLPGLTIGLSAGVLTEVLFRSAGPGTNAVSVDNSFG